MVISRVTVCTPVGRSVGRSVGRRARHSGTAPRGARAMDALDVEARALDDARDRNRDDDARDDDDDDDDDADADADADAARSNRRATGDDDEARGTSTSTSNVEVMIRVRPALRRETREGRGAYQRAVAATRGGKACAASAGGDEDGNKKGNPLEFMGLLMSLTKRW